MSKFDYSALGLEPRDQVVYETLYRLEKVSLRAIAQAVGMNRGTVYEVVKKLTGLGLVTFTQMGKRRHYSVAGPEALSSLIRDRKEQLKQLEAEADSYIQALQARRPLPGAEYFASFYEGDEGVAAILRDVLETMRSIELKEYCVISSQRASDRMYHNFKSFSRQRIKAGIFVRVISDRPPTDKVVLAERRQLPDNRQFLNGYTLIYGDKTALVSVGEANMLSSIVITDRGVANMQRLVFEQLWDGLVE